MGALGVIFMPAEWLPMGALSVTFMRAEWVPRKTWLKILDADFSH